MVVINILGTWLAWLGRHGAAAVALSIFVGLIFPALALLFQPYLGEAIFAMLCAAFLRVDPNELRALFVRPGLIVLAAVWVMVLTPALLASLFLLLGLNITMPDLYFILVLQSCGPALMSSPALAALIGLDVALTLASLIASTALAPITAGVFTHWFLGTSLASPLKFSFTLFLFIAGSAAIAMICRRIAGQAWIEAQREKIDGVSVLLMFIFAMAAMAGVAAHALSDPLLVAGLIGLCFLLAIGQIVVTMLVFLPIGRHRAFAIGLLTGNRNIGLMMAATGFVVPEMAWLYFGLAQLPIYLLPALLKPVAKRLQ